MDTLLSVLWISGAVVWLTGGLNHYHQLRVGCFAINCMTVVSGPPTLVLLREMSFSLSKTDSSVCCNECDPHLCPPGLFQHQTERFHWCLCKLLAETPGSSSCYFCCIFTVSVRKFVCCIANLSGVPPPLQMLQGRSESAHVWSPLCSFTAYLIAW